MTMIFIEGSDDFWFGNYGGGGCGEEDENMMEVVGGGGCGEEVEVMMEYGVVVVVKRWR
jgi:hypothetical protein